MLHSDIHLRPYKARIQAARLRDIGCSLHDSAAVGEEGQDMLPAFKAQQHAVGANLAVRLQARGHGGQVDRAAMFMNLHGVASAKRDVWAAFAAEVAEIAAAADLATGARSRG